MRQVKPVKGRRTIKSLLQTIRRAEQTIQAESLESRSVYNSQVIRLSELSQSQQARLFKSTKI